MKDIIKKKQLNEVLYGLDYIGNKVKNEDAVLTLGRNNCRLLLGEIERLNNIINKTSKKLEMTLNCIKDCMVENEEYIKIHTDYIYALEEQINILKGSDKE